MTDAEQRALAAFEVLYDTLYENLDNGQYPLEVLNAMQLAQEALAGWFGERTICEQCGQSVCDCLALAERELGYWDAHQKDEEVRENESDSEKTW